MLIFTRPLSPAEGGGLGTRLDICTLNKEIADNMS